MYTLYESRLCYTGLLCRIDNRIGDTPAFPANILYKSIAGRYRPVSVADGPITARYRFKKNDYWVLPSVNIFSGFLPHCAGSDVTCNRLKYL